MKTKINHKKIHFPSKPLPSAVVYRASELFVVKVCFHFVVKVKGFANVSQTVLSAISGDVLTNFMIHGFRIHCSAKSEHSMIDTVSSVSL
jgi:hypothetical protein